MKQRSSYPLSSGFTLVEVLVVLAIIGVMTSAVITVYKNVARDSNDVVARQQQVAVQNAVNNWVTAQTRDGQTSIATTRTTYNNATTSLAKLNLIQGYLDGGTYAHLAGNTTDVNQIASEALKRTQRYLQLGSWTAGNYPQVQLLP